LAQSTVGQIFANKPVCKTHHHRDSKYILPYLCVLPQSTPLLIVVKLMRTRYRLHSVLIVILFCCCLNKVNEL